MIKIAIFSLPVAILPLLAVQMVETVMTNSALPAIASTIQQSAQGEAMDASQTGGIGGTDAETKSRGVRLPLTLRF